MAIRRFNSNEYNFVSGGIQAEEKSEPKVNENGDFTAGRETVFDVIFDTPEEVQAYVNWYYDNNKDIEVDKAIAVEEAQSHFLQPNIAVIFTPEQYNSFKAYL